MNEVSKPIVFGKNVCFSYKKKLVLNKVSFSFYKGEHIGIIGESGCGKSTFLKLVAGLMPIEAGELVVNDEIDQFSIRKQISMVFQDAKLMPLSIRDNITLGHTLSSDKLERIIDAVMLSDWVSSLPDGLDTHLGNQANELSGGQAQRIAIARAMAKSSDIVLLDEPTSALDKATGVEVIEALHKLTAEKTVLAVTHQPELLKGYDRILKLEEGKLYEI